VAAVTLLLAAGSALAGSKVAAEPVNEGCDDDEEEEEEEEEDDDDDEDEEGVKSTCGG
jgi:ribosomal protein L12E/L44/L45/RPP1/RPP2